MQETDPPILSVTDAPKSPQSLPKEGIYLKAPAPNIEIVPNLRSAEATGSAHSCESTIGDEDPIQELDPNLGDPKGSADTPDSSATTDGLKSNIQPETSQSDDPQKPGRDSNDHFCFPSKRPRSLSPDNEDLESVSSSVKRLRTTELLGDLHRCIVNPENINATFEDIHITPDAIEALDSILLPLRIPGQFKVGILAKYPPTGLLLYGPPGTGKTLLVKALAKKAEATVLFLSSADIRSKYVGEGEKTIQKIFACARQWDGPFVIFIDEADALFGSRSSESNSRGHVDDLSQFLAEMDGINSSGLLNIMVVTATNRPFDIDEGILRRLGQRIFVDVPNIDGREAILKIHLRDEVLGNDVNLAELAKGTYDYTGSDLRDLVYATALTALREMIDATMPTQLTEQPPAQTRILQNRHFLRAKKRIRASPKLDTMDKIREFHTKFGNTAQRLAGSTVTPQVINKTKN